MTTEPQDTPTLDEIADTFHEIAKPDIPEILKPTPGQVDLTYGLEVDGERYRAATVRELNGHDEEMLAKLDPEKRGYLAFLMDRMIGLATDTIGPVAPRPKQMAQLLMGDRDALFLEIILTTYGEQRQYSDVICSNCEVSASYEVDIRGVVEFVHLEDENEPWTDIKLRDGREVRLHYPTGEDQMAIFQTAKELNVAEENSLMLSRCIFSVDGDEPRDRLALAKELSVLDRTAIVGALAKGPRVEFKEVEVPCENCGRKMPFTLGWADLLFRQQG